MNGKFQCNTSSIGPIEKKPIFCGARTVQCYSWRSSDRSFRYQPSLEHELQEYQTRQQDDWWHMAVSSTPTHGSSRSRSWLVDICHPHRAPASGFLLIHLSQESFSDRLSKSTGLPILCHFPIAGLAEVVDLTWLEQNSIRLVSLRAVPFQNNNMPSCV